MELVPKQILLQEGEIPSKLFLIEKGCIRAWYNKDGSDITFQFFFENQMVASIESMKKNIPSPITLETLEASTIWFINKREMHHLFQQLLEEKDMRNKIMDSLFERTFNYMHHFFSLIRDTPQQRYQKLLEDRPDIILRIPQHYIASYLGITPVHLSRIKRTITNAKK